jgi:hypothetical protein
MVFDIIASCFSLDDDEETALSAICANHCMSRAVIGNSEYRLSGGIRTGSSFTHLIGTITSMILMYYLGVDDFISYGDDVICNTKHSIKQIVSFFKKHSSFVIHPTKSRKGIDWLGLTLVNGSWVLPNPDKRMAQLFLPERGSVETDFVTLVQAHIINMGVDPLRWRLRNLLLETGNHILSPRLREVMYYWGKSFDTCDYGTIHELDDFVKAEFHQNDAVRETHAYR